MADQFPSDDDIELRRRYLSENSYLIDLLFEFMGALDAVQSAWLESSGLFSEPLERLRLAKGKIRKVFHSQITPPAGQTGAQFEAGFFSLIEEAWHLCRFVRSFRPDSTLNDADSKRIQSEMITRLPAIRDELRKVWLHLKFVLLREARDVSAGTENGEATAQLGNGIDSENLRTRGANEVRVETSQPPDALPEQPPLNVPLADRFEKAYQSYKWAEHKLLNADSTEVSDEAAWDYLKLQGFEGYRPPPEFGTWQRYVRKGREFYDDRKNTPRGGREGGSIVDAGET